MIIGVPSETTEGEKRVALIPEGAKALIGKSFQVLVESGAGLRAGFSDEDYEAAGCQVAKAASEVFSKAEIILKVNGPTMAEIGQLKSGSVTVSLLFPASNADTMQQLATKGASSFAMELMPRITRAQSMDVLSSMSTITGYKAALLAASTLPRFFPMLTTAAGTIRPAKVLVIGAGVAGLQAIATCRRLGAIVEGFDVRPAVKEQVESLGARFVSLPEISADAEDASGYAKEVSKDTHEKELDLLASRMPKNDVVITTALIPGKKAPVLITKEMAALMPRGSVIVDLAAASGGNVEGVEAGGAVEIGGTTVLGPTLLLSEMATDASRMYGKNLIEFLGLLAPEAKLNIDMEDQIIRETLVTHGGEVLHGPTKELLAGGPKP